MKILNLLHNIFSNRFLPKSIIILGLIMTTPLSAENSHPFNYDLHLTTLPSKTNKTMVTLHGMGGNYQIAEVVKERGRINETLVTFNFPDYSLGSRNSNPTGLTFGSIKELLPALFVLKKTIADNNLNEINLYGFSAGGGAIINILNVLTTETYDNDLKGIGITQAIKEQILKAIQKGIIILDSPLKSIGEIIALRGSSLELEWISSQYTKNKMEPIETLIRLHDLAFHILVYFETPDEILSNRDDQLFFERLEKANSKGTTVLIEGKNGSHTSAHPKLWNYYRQLTKG
jgi:hypothetical protein